MMISPRQQQAPHRRQYQRLVVVLVVALLGASSLTQAFFMPASAPRVLSTSTGPPAAAAARWTTTRTPQQARRGRRHGGGRRIVEMRLKFDPREDYYFRLGIERTASVNDIKRAYRRLALQTHPDVNKEPNAAETFKKVCEAYKVLSDADTRRQYDMMRGGAGTSSSSGGGAGRASWGAGAAGAGAGAGSSRQWYDQYDPTGFSARRPGEETADSIDDSFSSIFRDLVGSVAVRGSKGVFEDFVEFLERSVDGFGDESDAGFEEVLGSEDLEEVQKECESIQFLLNKLREKLQKAKMELLVLEGKLRVVQSPAAARDMEAVDKRLELVEQTAAMRARVQDLDGHIKRADRRQRRLMTRAEELRWGTPGGVRSAYSKYANPGVKGSASTRFNTAGGSSSSSSSSSSSGTASSSTSTSSSAGASASSPSSGGYGAAPKSSTGSVEEELQKLKKQMGLN